MDGLMGGSREWMAPSMTGAFKSCPPFPFLKLGGEQRALVMIRKGEGMGASGEDTDPLRL
jgi:hypothetical protein